MTVHCFISNMSYQINVYHHNYYYSYCYFIKCCICKSTISNCLILICPKMFKSCFNGIKNFATEVWE